MNEKDQPGSEQNLEAPPKLLAALKESSRSRLFVPRYVDHAIANAAQQHFAKPEGSGFGNILLWMRWPALAAACVLVAWAGRFLTTTVQPQYAREDLNHDGRVDILDSFALARELKAAKSIPATFDVNGDGVVDERDVDLIAAHAVKLEKGKGS